MSAVMVVDRTQQHADSRVVTLSRWLIAALFVVSGLAKVLSFTDTAGWMAAEGMPAAPAVLAATIALEVIGGLLLGAGLRVRTFAVVLIAFVVAATLQFHAFWAVPAQQLQDQLVHFLKNVAIIGGLSLLVYTAPGAPRVRLDRSA